MAQRAVATLALVVSIAVPLVFGACKGAEHAKGEAPAAKKASPATKSHLPVVRALPGSDSPVAIRVEVVATPDTRRVGLMYRKHLDPDAGMLFIMPQKRIQSFWMKNTFISLDMVFLDEDGEIVGIVADVPPETLEGRSVDAPSLYVLEVNAGFCAKHGIETGQTIDLSEALAWQEAQSSK